MLILDKYENVRSLTWNIFYKKVQGVYQTRKNGKNECMNETLKLNAMQD